MEFEDISVHYDDGSASLNWVCGNYEIAAFEHTDEITKSEGLIYYAFVAVAPLKANGRPGCVDNRRVGKPPYHSFDAAVAACEEHAKHA